MTELYLKYSEWALRFHSFLRTTHFFNSFGLMLYIFLKKISIVNPFWDVLQTKCKMFFKKTTLIYCVLCYECFEVLALSFSLLLLIFFQNLLNKFLKDFWWLPQKCWRSIVFVLHLTVIEMSLLCAKFNISSCFQSKVII